MGRAKWFGRINIISKMCVSCFQNYVSITCLSSEKSLLAILVKSVLVLCSIIVSVKTTTESVLVGRNGPAIMYDPKNNWNERYIIPSITIKPIPVPVMTGHQILAPAHLRAWPAVIIMYHATSYTLNTPPTTPRSSSCTHCPGSLLLSPSYEYKYWPLYRWTLLLPIYYNIICECCFRKVEGGGRGSVFVGKFVSIFTNFCFPCFYSLWYSTGYGLT